MFKNTNSKKVTGILLALVLVTACFIGGSIARYVTSTSSEDDARVAKWGFSETPEPVTMNLFKNEYKLDGNTVVAKSNDDADIIAPGLNGVSKFKFVTSSVSPEVMYEVKISVDDSEIADEIKNHPGIQWKVDNGNWVTWDEMVASLVALSGDPSGMKVYAPGELHNNFKNTTDHTIAWQWLMDAGYDEEDTEMGNAAVRGELKATIRVSVTARQVDVDSTGMIEGLDQTFDINNPEPLVFKSIAPLSELQSVKIGTTTLTDGEHYTKADGSTVITLKESFLSTLEEGKHMISIISTSMTAKTTFTVTKVEEAPINSPLVHNGVIPEGGVYYVGSTSTTLGDYTEYTEKYVAGNNFPETVNTGDIYVYEDYEYRYNLYFETDIWDDNNSYWITDTQQNGWGVKVLDKNKTEFTDMITTINNKDTTTLISTYAGCFNLTTAPKISQKAKNLTKTFQACEQITESSILPNTVENMNSTFDGCLSLATAPVIPENVINMNYTFYSCNNLTTAPIIPEKVTSIIGTFWYCYNLSGTLEINATNLLNYDLALVDTQIDTITGTISDDLKTAILATKIYE